MESAATATIPTPPARRSRAFVVLPVLVLIAIGLGTAGFALRRGSRTTDDAQIEGRVISVAARVPGQVARVLVEDNQLVKEGEPLVELDPRDLEARVVSARADLNSAKATLATMEAQADLAERTVESNLKQARGAMTQARAGTGSSGAAVNQARADLAAAESRAHLARLDLDRVVKLREGGAVAQAELDSRQAQFDQAAAAVDQARARLETARLGITSADGQIQTAVGRMIAAEAGPQQIAAARAAVTTAAARVDQAAAALRIAELNLSYATLVAPRTGVVSRRTVEVGQMVGPDRPLLALVPPDDVWIVANFKEDQLADMQPGQPATVTVDTYGRRRFAAHVASIAGASGARFALLPPDNASGNFVKVVQRIPVLLKLDGPSDVPLRPGMSAAVTVTTR